MQIPQITESFGEAYRHGNFKVYPKHGGRSISLQNLEKMSAEELEGYRIKFRSRDCVNVEIIPNNNLVSIAFGPIRMTIKDNSERGNWYNVRSNAAEFLEAYYNAEVEDINNKIKSEIKGLNL